MNIQRVKIAHVRAGDKGDTAIVGVIVLKPESYPVVVKYVTAAAVKEHVVAVVKAGDERFDLRNLNALNFLLHGSLGGGVTLSLMTDAQGKTLSTALLRMSIEVPDSELKDSSISE